MRKVDALSKAIEVECKKVKREAAAREKEASSMKADENKKIKNTDSSRRYCFYNELILFYFNFPIFSTVVVESFLSPFLDIFIALFTFNGCQLQEGC